MFIVRSFSRARGTREDFHVCLSGSALVLLKLKPGDLCQLRLNDAPPRVAIAWNALEKIQDNVAQTSRTLRNLFRFEIGDRITIERVPQSLAIASRVVVEECVESLELLLDD